MTGDIWITTGNQVFNNQTPAHREYPQSIVALYSTNLTPIAWFHVGGSQQDDHDFGAGPTFFNDTHGNRYVGATNKNGIFYAFNITALTPGNLTVAWQKNESPSEGSGSIAPAAFANGVLYITGGSVHFPHCSEIQALTPGPTNGVVIWHNHTKYNGTAYCIRAGFAVADGLLVDAANADPANNDNCSGPGVLEVRNAATGVVLFQHFFNESINGEPIVYDGQIFVGTGWINNTGGPNGPGYVAAFGIPLVVKATLNSPSHSSGHWTAGGYATVSGGMPGYNCLWNWGDGSNTSGCGTPSSTVTHQYSDSTSSSYAGNVTVTDFQGVRVVVPITVGVGYGSNSSVPGYHAYVALLNCGNSVVHVTGLLHASGGCAGSFASPLYVSGFSTLAGGTSPYTYSWSFGDGSAAVLTQNAAHSYSTAGTYTISMTGKDSGSRQVSASLSLTV